MSASVFLSFGSRDIEHGLTKNHAFVTLKSLFLNHAKFYVILPCSSIYEGRIPMLQRCFKLEGNKPDLLSAIDTTKIFIYLGGRKR